MYWNRFKLDTSINQPLYRQIADRMRRLIESGELPPGERLPSSRQLQKMLNVSAITIENGLSLLVEEGNLCRRPRCGTFVMEHPSPAAPNAKLDDPEYVCAVFCNMPTVSHYWYQVLSRLECGMHEAGFALMFRRQSTGGDSLAEIARYRNCRGIILCGYNSEQLSREIARQKLPVVLIGALNQPGSNSDLDQVMHNDEERAMISTRHLLDLGHRRIVCVTGPRDSQYSLSQKSGFSKMMKQYGVATDAANYIDLDDLDYESGIQAGYRVLCSSPRPTAVYIGSDPAARAILAVAEKLGIEAPRELSIVGCGGLELDRATKPRITTTVSAPAECARVAVEKLLAQIRAPDYRKSVTIVRISELSFGDTTMVCRENQPSQS